MMNSKTEFYKKNGYLIAENLLSAAEVELLRKETTAIFKGERGMIPGLIEAAGLTDQKVLEKYLAIHFPHKISDLIKDALFNKKIVDILTEIISPNLKAVQSMLFVKGPGKAGQAWHQDEYYIPTRDKSLVGAWIAIDDATVENGCLWIIPGSQKAGYMMKRVPYINDEFGDLDSIDISAYANQAIPVEVKSGSVVFFNGYTLHSSKRNKTTDCFRMALVNHYMSAESMLPWDQDGKLEPTEDLRDILMVAGVDPYAYKGTVDLNKPFLRPEKSNRKNR